LVKTFKKWGLPKTIRIDNGAPMADPQRKRISELALWLTGLGVEVIFNRPRRPTDNAKVERMQQTTKNWADIKNCIHQEQLQAYLNKVICTQRADYKVRRLGNKTRLECYPEIMTNQRKYDENKFDIQKTYEQLAQWQFVRQTSKSGQFSLYGQVYYLGINFAKQYISIKFDAQTKQWNVCDANGIPIRNITAKNMEYNHIWNLSICQ
jgi:hypothetical protein